MPLTQLFQRSVLLLALAVSPALAAPTVAVVAVGNPETSGFWRSMSTLMQTVAPQLELDLELHFSRGNAVQYRHIVDDMIGRESRPDYVILVGNLSSSTNAHRALDEAGIKTAIFNGSHPGQVSEAFRNGRDPLQHWIRQLLPDEEQSGRLLAESLIDGARARSLFNGQGQIEVIALNGRERSPSAKARFRGLVAYADSQPDVVLSAAATADWSPKLAGVHAHRMLKKHPGSSVVWAASDEMALGAMSAAAKSGMIILG